MLDPAVPVRIDSSITSPLHLCVCFVFTTSFDRTQSRLIMRTPHCLDICLFFLLFLTSYYYSYIIPNDFRPYRVPPPCYFYWRNLRPFFLQSPLVITSDAGGLARLNWANKSNETTCQLITEDADDSAFPKHPAHPLTPQGGRIPYKVNTAKTINTPHHHQHSILREVYA